jgi:hypothetical protein
MKVVLTTFLSTQLYFIMILKEHATEAPRPSGNTHKAEVGWWLRDSVGSEIKTSAFRTMV